MSQLKIYIGFDSRESIAWEVCYFSIKQRLKNKNIEIYPIKQQSVRELGLYTRANDQIASTEFSLTRFLTPYLAAHKGWTLFMDCDFLITVDISELLDNLDSQKAVYVVKHDYTPNLAIKMDNQLQTNYPRKNWSSFILFNNVHPSVKKLTPEVVNFQSPSYLHRFSWIEDEQIGEFPLEWNFLVGEYSPPPQLPKAIHFTNGGPWFENCKNVDYAELWIKEYQTYIKTKNISAEVLCQHNIVEHQK